MNSLRYFHLCDKHITSSLGLMISKLLDRADARLFRLVQRPEHCLHHLLPDTINSCYMESLYYTEVLVFPFLNANITCIKIHLFHGVCLNVFSYWSFDSLYAILVLVGLQCACFSCDACLCWAQINVYILMIRESLLCAMCCWLAS